MLLLRKNTSFTLRKMWFWGTSKGQTEQNI